MASTINPRIHRLRCSSLFTLLLISSSLLFLIFLSLHVTVTNLASQTKTLTGHNLDPTPWHPFDKPSSPPHTSSTIFKCSYLSCRFSQSSSRLETLAPPKKIPSCPSYFQSVYRDLEPWRRAGGITREAVEEARKKAAMRVTIVKGRVYVDFYYACVQSRAMFTIWGILQLVRRYGRLVPDVDFMFDCMDRPSVERAQTQYIYNASSSHLILTPLFRYCTTSHHFDIPFPDWSFWGWYVFNSLPTIF